MNGIEKEYHSVHSAPDTRMNRLEGIWFTRKTQNTRSFGKFLAGDPMRQLTLADIVILRPPPPGVFHFQILGAFFSKLKSRVFPVIPKPEQE